MLNQPMIDKLLAMRLHGMVEALKAQEQDRAVNELSFLERLALRNGGYFNCYPSNRRRNSERQKHSVCF